MIALLNYDRGNLRSVQKALEAVGAANVQLVAHPHELERARAMVLPGVGAFGDAARNLRERGLWEAVIDWVGADRPFLGICLGYQLLFEESEESPGVRGLGVFPGKVIQFPLGKGLKVPQIGWNTLSFPVAETNDCSLWTGLPENPWVYFVHSYYPAPADRSIIAAHCEYGVNFAAAISRGNIAATQFHPEKSQAVGLRILRNFVEHHRLSSGRGAAASAIVA